MRQLKKAVFNGSEIVQGDTISKDLNSETYIVFDFEEDGRPLCKEVGNANAKLSPYPYDNIFKLGGFLLE